VFFQERIWGADLRIHVVRDRCHGVLIRSPAVDYRYDRSGEVTEQPFSVPPDLAERCVSVTAALELEFSGIDFILSDHDDAYYCLEVNPMPGYAGYDLTLNYEISNSLGEVLSAR
jgi:glutathione synthase/RimK-type ligase-like ATP-grasp enzyme